jgi:hypothetical protein
MAPKQLNHHCGYTPSKSTTTGSLIGQPPQEHVFGCDANEVLLRHVKLPLGQLLSHDTPTFIPVWLIIGESVEHKVLPNPGLFIPTVSVELKTGKRGIRAPPIARFKGAINPPEVSNPH